MLRVLVREVAVKADSCLCVFAVTTLFDVLFLFYFFTELRTSLRAPAPCEPERIEVVLVKV